MLTDSEYDIELTEHYVKFCDEEAKDSLRNRKFIYGGVLLAVSIPIWNQYLTWLFKVTPNPQIGKTVLVCVMFVLLLLCVLILAALLNEAYADHSNKAHKKFKEIASKLKKLNLNLKLKYRK